MNADSGSRAADEELIGCARDVIRRNYDAQGERHTVGAAVRCGGGKIYAAVNVYDIHGACAEVVAIGMAVTAGEREFGSIVAVRGADGEEILPPCGNCRQILADYAPGCEVIMPAAGGHVKRFARDLLPAAFELWGE